VREDELAARHVASNRFGVAADANDVQKQMMSREGNRA
jgi:hypothetical protein